MWYLHQRTPSHSQTRGSPFWPLNWGLKPSLLGKALQGTSLPPSTRGALVHVGTAPALQTLALTLRGRNAVTAAAVRATAALVASLTLQDVTLRLSGNRIGPEGAVALAALCRVPALRARARVHGICQCPMRIHYWGAILFFKGKTVQQSPVATTQGLRGLKMPSTFSATPRTEAAAAEKFCKPNPDLDSLPSHMAPVKTHRIVTRFLRQTLTRRSVFGGGGRSALLSGNPSPRKGVS